MFIGEMMMPFAIKRDDALAQLAAFVPHTGSDYAKRRNYDYGQGAHRSVSGLSAALRRRTITEEEVISHVLGAHSFGQSEKFIQEVFWRTYWKGWLEMRPSLWVDYRQVVEAGFAPSHPLTNALDGQTDIACFDEWHRELRETNYLHNHARMWFASIWIHTLGLPWQAGADLFMRHLSDGDAASNTLGWRWVAGLQTRGKAYAARAENIAQFTNERFAPFGELNEDVAAIEGPENPPAMSIRQAMLAKGTKPLLLITPDDCHAESLSLPHHPVGLVSLAPALAGGARSTAVLAGDEEALIDARKRAHEAYQIADYGQISSGQFGQELHELMQQSGADHIVTSFLPCGYWHDLLADAALPLTEVQRSYDELCWPHAKKGFFPFKEKIPQFIKSLAS